MLFNEEQTKTIYEIIMKYNTEFEYRDIVENKYQNNKTELSILEIYALEQVLRYGTDNLFQQFQESVKESSLEQSVKLYDDFIQLLREDENFKKYKLDQFKTVPETLSEIEIFIFKLLTVKEEKKASQENQAKLTYDEFNPIRYKTDNQIRTTIENLLFGKFIIKALELPNMQAIRNRQKVPGLIATEDKPLVINEIRKLLFEDLDLYKSKVDEIFCRVKFQLLLGKGEESFGEYLNYNTNISSDEIFDRERVTEEENIYQFFYDMVNKRKNQTSDSNKK